MASDFTGPVDLANCDREPIHIPGSIQPHGAMLVCDPETGKVIFASETAEDLLGQRNSNLIGLTLEDILGANAAHDLRNAAMKVGSSHLAGVVLGLKLPNLDMPVDAVTHQHKDRLFVEIEPTTFDVSTAQDALEMTQSLVRRIGFESNVDKIATIGARLIRGLLGYDRVMVYQFLHNGAGHVIAEAKAPNLNSFMGQHFPASDIPYQARRLYLENTIRMIGDVNFAPVPLLPRLKAGEEPIDMSFAQLRSVSPIHCEYLRNMGVGATMSISVVVDGELWGLISCHHDSPKIIPMPLRVGAELFGQYFSMQIALAERRAALIATNDARARLDQIVSDIQPGEAVDIAVTRHLGDLAGLIANDGASISVNGSWSANGRVPAPAEAAALMAFVSMKAAGNVWATAELGSFADLHGTYGTEVAGLLAIPISSVSRDYLILFRSEEAYSVEWAGEPVKQIVSGPSGPRLSPRGSFDTWREDVRGRSKPWTDRELSVADTIRVYLRDVVLRYNEATSEERERVENRRRVLNDELNHRVKNILALVKSIARQTGATAASVEDYASAMEGRLRALAFAHDQSLQAGSGGDLATLITAEASLHRYGSEVDRITAEGPAVGLSDRSFGVFALVIHELMTNAAKYGALAVPEGRLSLTWHLTDSGDCRIIWQERAGPSVTAPTRTGFGSKLIQTTMTYDLGGTATVAYDPDGLRADLIIPASHLVAVADIMPAGTAVIAQAHDVLAQLDVLLVEDQALIAMDTEDTLRKLGAGMVRLAANVAQSKDEIAAALPDFAVLDYNLGHETSAEVADMLADLSVPFLFVTGYGDNVIIPDRFKHMPIVRKPVSATALAARIESLRA
ncbi:HWE histidine kinase domain-containing protein [Novosphingobium sp.]|uniref:HWE histidine kinase domain-containing protein n=1 Tax=Novosphingobium sp. TaxID=1874826 RepID=UPI003B5208C1